MGEVVRSIAGQTYQLEIGICKPPTWHGPILNGARGTLESCFLEWLQTQSQLILCPTHSNLVALPVLAHIEAANGWFGLAFRFDHRNQFVNSRDGQSSELD